jgi:putative heme transporter
MGAAQRSEHEARESSAESGGRPRSRVRTSLQAGFGVGLALVLIVYVLPRLAKTNWGDVWVVLSGVPWTTFLLLLVGVVVGLYCYTFTLTASLPGLRHWQALIVNVAGSSVGNLLPGGGAAGLAATYTICRSWGFSRRDISTSAIVTGVWNVLARVALPLVAILALFTGRDPDVPRALADAAIAGAVTGAALLAAFVAILASERAAVAIGHGIDKVIGRLWRRRSMNVKALVIDLRARISGVVRTGWLKMTLGLVGFFGVYFGLFVVCMHTTGVELFYGQLFAAYAIGRLLTAVGLTPGGLGITESGTVAALVAWGAHPADALAAVVLFSFFTHLMEIPLGALGWVAWSISPKKHAEEAEPAATEALDG